jgi:hypothetical protein
LRTWGAAVLRPYAELPGGACCELGGEAVGGDGLELPGGELVEAFFVGG